MLSIALTSYITCVTRMSLSLQHNEIIKYQLIPYDEANITIVFWQVMNKNGHLSANKCPLRISFKKDLAFLKTYSYLHTIKSCRHYRSQ